jgi:hypothetical protein
MRRVHCCFTPSLQGSVCSLACGWLPLTPAYAQPGGTITGRVADETGGVLPRVTVDLHSDGMETFAVTNETGDYGIDNVPAGPAELTFKLINFSTSVAANSRKPLFF